MLDYLRNWRRERYINGLKARGLKLGKDVFLNDGFFLDPSHCHLIEIEDGVVFGPRVMVFAHDASSFKLLGKTKIAIVTLKRNCFIGANSVILPGSIIGENSVVGAGSVVAAHIPDNELWAGVPARRLMSIDDYKVKLSAVSGPEFTEDLYCLDALTPERRTEMLEKLGGGTIGFMKF